MGEMLVGLSVHDRYRKYMCDTVTVNAIDCAGEYMGETFDGLSVDD